MVVRIGKCVTVKLSDITFALWTQKVARLVCGAERGTGASGCGDEAVDAEVGATCDVRRATRATFDVRGVRREVRGARCEALVEKWTVPWDCGKKLNNDKWGPSLHATLHAASRVSRRVCAHRGPFVLNETDQSCRKKEQRNDRDLERARRGTATGVVV